MFSYLSFGCLMWRYTASQFSRMSDHHRFYRTRNNLKVTNIMIELRVRVTAEQIPIFYVHEC